MELLVVALLCTAVLGFVLALPSQVLLSAPSTDLMNQFAAWRAFAAASLLAGDLPLWNPHTYGGHPFLGDFQSALLYPLNAVFLILPLERALNFSMLLHLLVLGWGIHRWAIQRGLHPAASALAAAIVALGGTVWPQLYAGHLSNLCSLAWTPWLLAGLETWYRKGKHSGLLQGSAAACLQILGGHMQYVFLTGVAATLLAVVHALTVRPVWHRSVSGMVVVYAGAIALAAAQFFPGLAVATETVRQDGIDYDFARTFSLPPENLLTLAAPDLFGALVPRSYWGRWYFWETNLFVGGAACVLLWLGLTAQKHRKLVWSDAVVAAVLFLLALGGYTPLLHVLHENVPGFDRFRGMAKFAFPAVVLLALIAAVGADTLLRQRTAKKRDAILALAAGTATMIAGFWLMGNPTSVAALIAKLHASGETFLPPALAADPSFVATAATISGRSALAAGIPLALVGGALLLLSRRPVLRWVPFGVAAVELTVFAIRHTTTATLSAAVPETVRHFVAENPGDHRVLNLVPHGAGSNNGFLLGAPDLWGNNPAVLKRYAEFMTFLQGGPPDLANQYVPFTTIPPQIGLLRGRFAFIPLGDRIDVRGPSVVLPQALLVSEFQIHAERDALFAALQDPAFDARRTVLLETAPVPQPAPTDGEAAGQVRVLDATSPDVLTIEADLRAPALLVLTDLYTRDWRAHALPGSSQQRYEILPANYVLRAIPLAAGRHHLRVEYVPRGFHAGVAVSILAWLLWLVCAVAGAKIAMRRNHAPEGVSR